MSDRIVRWGGGLVTLLGYTGSQYLTNTVWTNDESDEDDDDCDGDVGGNDDNDENDEDYETFFDDNVGGNVDLG